MAQPTVTAVENAASNLVPGLPNSTIAQGAIMVVYGSGLGPANIVVAPAAFQSTTLSNTSVAVTVGGTTVNAPMYYTSGGQVAALLPSNTPTGTGTITVTYNGQTSAKAPIIVVANNLGVFTIDSSGAGPGIVTYPDYSLVSPLKAANCGGPNTTCGAANPGDTLILWATGLGPVNGNDASGAGLGQNMPNVPLTLWLGSVQAPVVYQGRSGCCVGEDQIVFTVPNNVPVGCAVPLVAQIGNQVSNTTVMPVANGSRTCPLVNPASAMIGTQQIEQLITAGPVTFTSANIDHFSDGNGTFEDDAKLQFVKSTGYVPGTQPFFASWIDDQPSGTCMVYGNLNTNNNAPFTGGSVLDAGSTYTVTGPKGSMTLPLNGKTAAFSATGAFLVPGNYTFSGAGGANIGPFSGSFVIPAPATLVSPANNGTATRANGLPVNWTGGSGILQIQVNSCSDNSCNSGAAAICNVPASAGTFTIPPYVMEALPASTAAGVVLSNLSTISFTATGLNAGFISIYGNDSGFGYGWGSGNFTLK
ncbi:MAG TPA: hypothetical protein VKB88_42325 [Bryobacteraceae bacterium]|nr:hypothetical protein [Bryobacteraceae bacterium]